MGQHGLRDMACNWASINWAKAAEYSKQIDEPWYACQALAWCGRFAPHPDSDKLIDRAFQWAEAGKDAYQRLAATAWPLRALIELGDEARAEREFDRIKSVATLVELNASRGEACLLVYEAMAVAQRELVLKAFHWLASACQPVEHWRQKRALCSAAIEAVTCQVASPGELLPFVQDERMRTNLAIRLDRGETASPRRFFWTLR